MNRYLPLATLATVMVMGLGFQSCDDETISDVNNNVTENDSLTFVYQIKYDEDFCKSEDSLAYIDSYLLFYDRMEEELEDASIDSLDGFAVRGLTQAWCDSVAKAKAMKVADGLSGVTWGGHFGFTLYNWMTNDSLYHCSFDSPATNSYWHYWEDHWYWTMGEMCWDTDEFMTDDYNSYITDIKIFGCPSKGQRHDLLNKMATDGVGYVMASDWSYCCDLNENAGGWYVYMGLHFGSRYSNPITDIVFLENPAHVPDQFIWRGRTYYRADRYGTSGGSGWDGNLNSAAGGWYIYCYYTRDYTGKILTCADKGKYGARLFWGSASGRGWNDPVDGQRINCAAFASYNLNTSNGYWYHGDNPDYGSLDMNRGAGGDDIFCTPKVKTVDKNLTFPSYSTAMNPGQYKVHSSSASSSMNKINDGNTNTYWTAYMSSGSPAWIIFESNLAGNDSIQIGGFTLTMPGGLGNNIANAPTSWKFYGTNDNPSNSSANWKELGRNSVSNSSVSNKGEHYTQIECRNRFRYFKLVVDGRHGKINGDIQVAEFKLHGAVMKIESAQPSGSTECLTDDNRSSIWGIYPNYLNPYIIWKASHYTKVKQYTIESYPSTYWMGPKGWKLMGCQTNSPNEKDWIVLDEATNVPMPFAQTRTIPDNKAGYFLYYKWVPVGIFQYSSGAYEMMLGTLKFDTNTMEVLTGTAYATDHGQPVVEGDLDLLPPHRQDIPEEVEDRQGYSVSFPHMHYINERRNRHSEK